MRLRTIAASFAVLCACATALPPFRPADPAQAVAHEPEAATASVAGVRLTVRPGSWSGWPHDLANRLTPVEIAIENDGGRALQVRPGLFGLVAPNGSRYEALDAQAVRRRLEPYPPSVGFYYGFYGVYPWPGFYRPWTTRFYPYVWWGFRPGEIFPATPNVYAPMPGRAEVAPEGILENGGHASILLFFPIPAVSLQELSFDVHLVDASGQPTGDVRMPFVREGRHPPPPTSPPAPPSAAPATPPAAPPEGPPPIPPPAPGSGTDAG